MNSKTTENRKLTIVSLVKRSWRALKAGPLIYPGFALIAIIFITAFFSLVSPEQIMSFVRSTRGFGLLILPQLFWGFFLLPIQGAAAYILYLSESREKASFVSAIVRSARAFPAIVAIQLIKSGLIILSIIVVMLSLAAVFPLWIRLLVFLFILLLIETRWVVAVPVCVIERCGPVRGVNRSSELTSGSALKIFFIMLLMSAVNRVFVVKLVPAITSVVFEDVISIGIPNLFIAILALALEFIVTAALYCELNDVKGTCLDSTTET